MFFYSNTLVDTYSCTAPAPAHPFNLDRSKCLAQGEFTGRLKGSGKCAFTYIDSHHQHIVGFKPVTLTASCLPRKLLHNDYACLTLCFSSEPKLQNINNSSAAVKCRFQNAANVSQMGNMLSCFPPLDNSKQSYFCRLFDYSSQQREEYSSLTAYVDLRVKPP